MSRLDSLKQQHAASASRQRLPGGGLAASSASAARARRRSGRRWGSRGSFRVVVVLVVAVLIALRVWQHARPAHPQGYAGAIGSGTGFFVSPDGLLLTAAHVVAGSAHIAVKSDDAIWPAQVLRIDKANDIAVLRVAVDRRVPAIALGESGAVRMGESVFTVGYPNIELQGVSPKLTRGEISSITGIQDDPRIFQISVPVQPGNSGGPLVDLQGRVIGVVIAQLDGRVALAASGAIPQNVNYAIKSSYVQSLLETLPGADTTKPQPVDASRPFDQVVESVRNATGLILVEINP